MATVSSESEPLSQTAKGQTYQWDGLGRLVGVKDRTGAQLGTYLYDANNRRVRKTCPNGSGGLKTTDYVYDGWQVLEEREGGNPVRRYVYGRELDEPVMMEVITGATAIRYFYHQDLNHNVAGLTDIYGNLVESYYYDPYGMHVRVLPGNQRAAEASSTVDNPYLFAGRTFDSETGLYYNRNRYYDPHVGRFISRDPIGIQGGLNLYAYVNGNPVNLLDPMGLEGTALDLQEGLRGALTIPSQADNRYSGYLQGPFSGAPYEDYQRINSAQWAVEDTRNALWNTALNAGTSILGWGSNYAYFKDGYNESGPLTWDNRLAYGMADASMAMGLATMGLMASEAGLAANGIGTEIDLGQETIAVCPNSQEAALNNLKSSLMEDHFSTPSDGAAFWAGYKQGNQAAAMEWAKANGASTIEMTPGGAWLDSLDLYGPNSPISRTQADELWGTASEMFARGASGKVSAFTRGVPNNPTSVFYNKELPLLRSNPNVSPTITYRGY